MIAFVKAALEYASARTGINYKLINDYLKMYAADRRYKFSFKACTASWNYNQNGIITYRGRDYYYSQSMDGVAVEYR